MIRHKIRIPPYDNTRISPILTPDEKRKIGRPRVTYYSVVIEERNFFGRLN